MVENLLVLHVQLVKLTVEGPTPLTFDNVPDVAGFPVPTHTNIG